MNQLILSSSIQGREAKDLNSDCAEGQGRIGETSRRWNQVDMRGGNRGLEYCAPSSYHTAGAKFVLNGFEFPKTGKIRASWGKCSNNKFSRISS